MYNQMLQQLGLKYGTDKSSHTFKGKTYCDIYDKHFQSIRESVKVFIEIGVKDGQSIRMFEEYFPNAMIYGIDIDPRCKQFETNRTRILIGDQNDDRFLSEIRNIIGPYDILLDDGSHITTHQIKTFDVLYSNMKPGGFYIIEDLRNSYEESGVNDIDLRKLWPGMIYNNQSDPLKNYRSVFNQFIQQHVKLLDLHRHPSLFSIYHYPMIVIFENATA
jgi:hypothetical protein